MYLALLANALSGTIPSQFGALSALTVLSLVGGIIPSQFGVLTALTALSLVGIPSVATGHYGYFRIVESGV
jgi:hypothetical protein